VEVAYYTNRFDPVFHNRQDVELVELNAATSAVTDRQRLTSLSNESEADPLLGGLFIGDYIEVYAAGARRSCTTTPTIAALDCLTRALPYPSRTIS
jgi:hypothetical protein